MNGRGDRDRGLLGLGLVLIVLGLLFFGAETMRFDWEQYGWPIYVIAPGLFLLVAGLASGGEGGLGLAIPGGIVTAVGLLLAYQR